MIKKQTVYQPKPHEILAMIVIGFFGVFAIVASPMMGIWIIGMMVKGSISSADGIYQLIGCALLGYVGFGVGEILNNYKKR